MVACASECNFVYVWATVGGGGGDELRKQPQQKRAQWHKLVLTGTPYISSHNNTHRGAMHFIEPIYQLWGMLRGMLQGMLQATDQSHISEFHTSSGWLFELFPRLWSTSVILKKTSVPPCIRAAVGCRTEPCGYEVH